MHSARVTIPGSQARQGFLLHVHLSDVSETRQVELFTYYVRLSSDEQGVVFHP